MKRFLMAVLPGALIALLIGGVAYSAPRLGDTPKIIERLNGSPQYSQDLSATTTTGTQSTAFNGGETLLVVPSAAVRCRAVTSGSGTVTTTNGVPLAADEKFYLTLRGAETHLACITASGTSTVQIWKME